MPSKKEDAESFNWYSAGELSVAAIGHRYEDGTFGVVLEAFEPYKIANLSLFHWMRDHKVSVEDLLSQMEEAAKAHVEKHWDPKHELVFEKDF